MSDVRVCRLITVTEQTQNKEGVLSKAMPKDLDELLSMRDMMDRALVGKLSRSLHQVDRMLLR